MTPTCFLCPFAWNIFFYPLTLMYYLSFVVPISWQQQVDSSCFFLKTPSASLCLLIVNSDYYYSVLLFNSVHCFFLSFSWFCTIWFFSLHPLLSCYSNVAYSFLWPHEWTCVFLHCESRIVCRASRVSVIPLICFNLSSIMTDSFAGYNSWVSCCLSELELHHSKPSILYSFSWVTWSYYEGPPFYVAWCFFLATFFVLYI